MSLRSKIFLHLAAVHAVLAVIACVVFILIGNPSVSGWVPEAFRELSFSSQFDVMQRGIIEIRNILFMLVVGAGFVIASIVMLDDRKAA